MTWGMDVPGDITDEFDDDSLRLSIERADQQGEWRDVTPFVDPKLETIKRQLEEPERANYTQRRLRELQQEASLRAAGTAALGIDAIETAAAVAPRTETWRHAVVPGDGLPLANAAKTTPVEPNYVVSDRSVYPVLSHLRPVVAGLYVFVPIGAVHVVITGWHDDVLVRVLLASIVAGVAWRKLDVGRFRAAAVGAIVHMMAFFASARGWNGHEVLANSAGFVIAAIGSLLVGSVREAQKLLADRPR
jgi:hypothetical protein